MPVSTLTRFESIADIPLNDVNKTYFMPTNGGLIPNDRYLHSLRLQLEGRITLPGSAAPTSPTADSQTVFSLIESIIVEGYHRPRGAREQFINVRGSDLMQLNRIYLSGLDAPMDTVFDLSAAVSGLDFRGIMHLPFVPLNMPAQTQMNHLLDAPNYEALTLSVRFADDKNLASGGTTPSTFTAYGSSSGSPRLRIGGMFAMGGASRFAGFVPARVWRYYQESVGGDFVAGKDKARLFNFPRGWSIRNVLAKFGTKATDITSGNNAFATLSNTVASNFLIYQGTNKVIRRWDDLPTLQADAHAAYGVYPQPGYGLIDFASQGLIGESLRTQSLVAGPDGDVDLFLSGDIAGASDQAGLFLTEEIRGRSGTLPSRRNQPQPRR